MVCELQEWVAPDGGVISKKELSVLPPCCKETWLGDPKGALKQYRCAHGFHVREYPTWFEVHRDKFDPRQNPVKHLVYDTDAPALVAGLVALAIVKAVYG
ncbi:MAG: hypothetical protein QW514_02620 [Thermoprotei archaeon]